MPTSPKKNLSIQIDRDSTSDSNSPKTKILDKIKTVFNSQYQRVMLIQLPQFSAETMNIRIVKNKRYYNYPPYGLGVLCSNLKKKKYDVEILDLNMDLLEFIHNEENEKTIRAGVTTLWQEEITHGIEEFKPDVIGISCMFTMSHEILIEVSDFIKSNWPALPLTAGGVHVTNAPETVLKAAPGLDFLFLYEADQVFSNFLDFVKGDFSSDGLNQIGTLVDDEYLDIEGRSAPNSESMDILPDYLNLNIEKYSSLGEIGNFRYWLPENTRISSVLSNRGCRARCSFCSVRNFNGDGVRARSIGSVIDEIEDLQFKYDINHITWLDDDLFYDPKRTVQLFNEIVKRNLNITWDAMNGIIAAAAAIHPETIHAAAESGCIAVNYGVESGNREILGSIHKPSGIKHCLKVGELMRLYPQIYSRVFLIIGFPNETRGQMLDTVNLAQEMKLDWYGIQKLTPLPSTEIYGQMVDQGLIEEDSLNLDSGYSGFLIREAEIQRVREANEKLNAKEFMNYFESDLDAVPTMEELDDIWLIMDYKINYEKILTEENPVNLKKMQCFLKDVSNRMTVDHPLANLYLGIVESKLNNMNEATKYISLSKELLGQSDYWQKRFNILDIDRLYSIYN